MLLRLVLLIFLLPTLVFAKVKTEDTTEYFNQLDDDLTISELTLLPTYDNIKGVYSKPVDQHIEKRIKENHHWAFVKNQVAGTLVKPEDLVGNPNKVKEFSRHFKADAFFTAETRKDPKGLQVSLYLFSAKSGKLITEERVKQVNDTTDSVLYAIDGMMDEIIKKIPYDGIVASRVDNRVTVNLGQVDGVQSGQTLTAVKIVSASRHPKRDFIIKSNKAIIGQIRLVKVDKKISFADILSETEPGVITKGVKLTGASSVKYNKTKWTKNYTPPQILLSEDNKTIYGGNPKERKPTAPPTFGKVGAKFSIGQFANSYTERASGQTYNTTVNVYPRIDLNGELWISPNWYIQGTIAQGIGSSPNPQGSPTEVSNSLSQYRLAAGYNFLLKNDFFGPKFSIDLGFNNYRMFVGDTTPTTFTTLEYRSFVMGIGGWVPVTRSKNWAIGGNVYFHFFPSLDESPISYGGADQNSINQFSFYAENKLTQRMRLKFGLDFHLLSTTYASSSARTNQNHRHMMLNTALDYMF